MGWFEGVVCCCLVGVGWYFLGGGLVVLWLVVGCYWLVVCFGCYDGYWCCVVVGGFGWVCGLVVVCGYFVCFDGVVWF